MLANINFISYYMNSDLFSKSVYCAYEAKEYGSLTAVLLNPYLIL